MAELAGDFMYDMLVKLIIAAVLLELGISFSNFGDCSSLECRKEFHRPLHFYPNINLINSEKLPSRLAFKTEFI